VLYDVPMCRRLAVLCLVASAACCSKSEVKGAAPSAAVPTKPTFTLFALAEVRGQIGPCGCTSDPLGDISRTTAAVDDARQQGPVMVVDAGSLLYAQNPLSPRVATEENLKADLLAKIYSQQLHVEAIGLGPADLADGPSHVRLARQACDATASGLPIAQPKVVQVGDAKVGVFGVVDKDATPGVSIADPTATGKQVVARLHEQGAQIVVALVQATDKRAAVQLVRDIGGIDVAIAGLGANAPEPADVPIEPDHVGDAWLVVPGNRGQVVSRLDVYLRGPGPLADGVGSAEATGKIARIDHRVTDLDADIAKFAADPSADAAFLAKKRGERAELVGERGKLSTQPLQPPQNGSFFTLAQVRIKKTLACNLAVQDEITAFDRAAGSANVAAAASEPPPPAPKGAATYVGMDKCDDCHADAVKFWKQTVHAQAWQTLVDRGQQFDYECIGCHVTGWEKPGGTNMAHTEHLLDVQCETCHGPGSIHVAKGGEEKPSAVRRAPAEDLCASLCHTHEHSDTFQHDAYLRDIVGKGHGEELRKKLGDGATGHELRQAALAKAGTMLGSGCKR
jgi:hypothetical protein